MKFKFNCDIDGKKFDLEVEGMAEEIKMVSEPFAESVVKALELSIDTAKEKTEK